MPLTEDDDVVLCDHCDKPAMVNYQRAWVSYPIVKGEYGIPKVEYNLEPEPVGEDNRHLCELHEERWLEGEYDEPKDEKDNLENH